LATARSPVAAESGTHEGVLLSLLNEMDGVEELIGVTVIGATNRPEALVSYSAHPILCRAVPADFEKPYVRIRR
jgi:AAA family ATPase